MKEHLGAVVTEAMVAMNVMEPMAVMEPMEVTEAMEVMFLELIIDLYFINFEHHNLAC